MSRSLRSHLLLVTTGVTSVVLGLLGLGIYIVVRHSLLVAFDAALVAQTRTLAGFTEQSQGTVSVEYDSQQMPEFSPGRHAEYFQMWRDDGSVLLRSPSLGQQDMQPRRQDHKAAAWPLVLPNGRSGRAVETQFTPRLDSAAPSSAPAETIRLVVAADAEDLTEALEQLRWLLLGACSAAILLSDGILVITIRASFRSLRHLSQEIEALGGADPGQRFATGDLPKELVPVVDRLNELFQRIGEAFQHERGFTADVAHELRTPLAGLQATLEVCRSKPREQTAYEAAIDKCLAVIFAMQQMVEQLLLLARADRGQLAVVKRSFDFCSLAEECWAGFQTRAAQRGLRVTWEMSGQCMIQSDPERLQIILRNLFDNAASYTNPGGTIRINTHGDDRALLLTVANTGSDVALEDAHRVFERFWQGDPSRASTGEHCGLGLSLCERLTGLLGGQITVHTRKDGWFTVELAMPISSSFHPGTVASSAELAGVRPTEHRAPRIEGVA